MCCMCDGNIMVPVNSGGISPGVLSTFWIGLTNANFQEKNLKVNCNIIAKNSITFSGGTSLLNVCSCIYL